MIYADQRWIGDHGIGRFARHVLADLDYCPLTLRTHPAAPLDTWRLTRALGNLTEDDLFFSPGYNTPRPAPHLSSSQFTILVTFTARRIAAHSFGCITQRS